VSLLGCLDAFKSRNREAGAVTETIHDQLQRAPLLSGMPGDATRLGKLHRHSLYFIVRQRQPSASLPRVRARENNEADLPSADGSADEILLPVDLPALDTPQG
jgi:hypothetical protein